MNEPAYSSSWYRIAPLKPRLKKGVQIHRQQLRGEICYVLENRVTQSFYKVTPEVYSFLSLLDGARTIQEIWYLVCQKQGKDAPTQNQVIQLLHQLHRADAINSDVVPNTPEVRKQHQQRKRRIWLQGLVSPLFWRIPLFDPDRLLDRLLPLVRPLFSRISFFIWFLVVCAGAGLLCMNWRDLTGNLSDQVFASRNLLLLALLIPSLKFLHELGHAFAVKVRGGEVHEMGVQFLVFVPYPYMDASAASAFPGKFHRILVGAAGMMVDVFLASLALMAWLNMEPGVVRSALSSIIFIAGVSTILFNANPLLRFDAYYILSDVLEIPNLRTRSERYLQYLIHRYILGRGEVEFPRMTGGERSWYIFYSLSSRLYRIVLLAGIVLFLAGKFFFLGALLAIWGILGWGVLPLARGLRSILVDPGLRDSRGRAVLALSGFTACILALLFLVPAPLRMISEGVIWVPEEMVIRAGAEGFISGLLAAPGERVRRGDPLFACEDPAATTRLKITEAEIQELQARRNSVWLRDRVESRSLDEEIAHLQRKLALEKGQIEELTVRSRCDGIFVVPRAGNLPGRFVKKGDSLGHVLDPGSFVARVVIPQEEIDLVNHRAREIRLRFIERLQDSIPVQLVRLIPGASKRLPTPALGTRGGGKLVVDPGDEGGTRAVQKYFQVELRLPPVSRELNVGSRVFVCFDCGWEPLGFQWYRGLRKLLLEKFDV